MKSKPILINVSCLGGGQFPEIQQVIRNLSAKGIRFRMQVQADPAPRSRLFRGPSPGREQVREFHSQVDEKKFESLKSDWGEEKGRLERFFQETPRMNAVFLLVFSLQQQRQQLKTELRLDAQQQAFMRAYLQKFYRRKELGALDLSRVTRQQIFQVRNPPKERRHKSQVYFKFIFHKCLKYLKRNLFASLGPGAGRLGKAERDHRFDCYYALRALKAQRAQGADQTSQAFIRLLLRSETLRHDVSYLVHHRFSALYDSERKSKLMKKFRLWNECFLLAEEDAAWRLVLRDLRKKKFQFPWTDQRIQASLDAFQQTFLRDPENN